MLKYIFLQERLVHYDYTNYLSYFGLFCSSPQISCTIENTPSVHNIYYIILGPYIFKIIVRSVFYCPLELNLIPCSLSNGLLLRVLRRYFAVFFPMSENRCALSTGFANNGYGTSDDGQDWPKHKSVYSQGTSHLKKYKRNS